MRLKNIILPDRGPKDRWEVEVESNEIKLVIPTTVASPTSDQEGLVPTTPSEPSSILIPTLCHPHIHLDKPYLLTCNAQYHSHYGQSGSQRGAEYSDLTPQSGTFDEALSFTGQAKSRYTPEDLYLRGAQLLATSLTQGVTSCRAFVELDHITGTKCLEAAIELKKSFEGKFEVQICAFAQDPIFSSDHGDKNREILQDAVVKYGEFIEALGTTPYVESSRDASLRNISWAIDTALNYGLHLDFHLDYNLNEDEGSRPLVWDVLRSLKHANWNQIAKRGRTIVLGHCSQLTLLNTALWKELARRIQLYELPVHFVGLPTSDLFMMGRPTGGTTNEDEKPAQRPRGTLQVLNMIREFRLEACLSVNNVGNAFTPWGTGDPLALACLGVGVYQAGTEDDARILLECVSSRARRAIGLDVQDHDTGKSSTERNNGMLWEGRKGDLLLIRNEEWVGCPGHLGVKVPARQRVSIKDVVWDPPESSLRRILR